MTGAFRAVAYLEALSYLLLLTATVVHRGFDGPDMVSALGPIHGILFLVYVVLVLKIRASQGWGFWWTIGIIVLSAVPFGGFWAGSHVREDTPAVAAS
jgi:integral membrane protein